MTRTDIINELIKKFDYKSYLEIGVQHGKNFFAVKCKNKTGIDPEPFVEGIIYKTSDNFFLQNTKKFDIIFIDGLHHSEQVYNDILNSLYSLKNNGTVVCHDMNPLTKVAQEVPRKVKQWNGDCWKAWAGIKKCKGLEMFVVNTDHGVGIIRKKKFRVKIDEDFMGLNYRYLRLNRKELLNLISIKQFKKWLNENN